MTRQRHHVLTALPQHSIAIAPRSAFPWVAFCLYDLDSAMEQANGNGIQVPAAHPTPFRRSPEPDRKGHQQRVRRRSGGDGQREP